LPRSSDGFWKFSACKVYTESSGRNFTVYASKDEAVCLGVQTHFGSSLPASLAEKVLGAYSRFLRPKTKRFAVKFRRILDVLRIQGYKKISGRIFTIYASKNKAVCCEVQTDFGSFLHASFMKKFLAQFHD